MSHLQEIARGQQKIADNGNKGQGAFLNITSTQRDARANTRELPLRQGKFSFDSNPVSPPWVTMPDGGFPFSSNGTINTPAIGSGFVDVIGPNGQYQFQVPNGYDGVIRRLTCFYNGGGFISGSGALIWRILQDGQAVRNYDNILVQLGVMPFPGETEGIRISSNQTIQFQVDNVSLAGVGTQIFCFFGGWFYPCKLS
jgi:hypothetical protein